jgi:putative membrane protein insertion efficiency factor
VKYLFMTLIRIYQRTISPLLGPVCRYYPSCSQYGYEAMSVHGALKGTILTAWRILRCNPWSAGGVDEVPPRGRWRPPAETGAVGHSHEMKTETVTGDV